LNHIEKVKEQKLISPHRKTNKLLFTLELTEAMLLQESAGLREAIDHAKSSIHAYALAEEIQQAQSLVEKIT
jgi:hypothetical protein